MDRKVLVELLRNGMRYPVGRHQIWVSRCFEITVRPDKVIEVDEFETYDERCGLKPRQQTVSRAKVRDRMYHIGRSVIHLKDRRIIEEASGAGWVAPNCDRTVLSRGR